MYSINASEVPLDVIWRPLAASLAAAGLLMLVFRLIGKKWRRAALATSLVLVLFFSYGHVYRQIWINYPTTIFGRANVLFAIWATVMIMGVWALLRIVRKTSRVTIVLNAMSSALVVFLVVGMAANLWNQQSTIVWKEPETLHPTPGPNWDGTKPDIYYIILDGYGSEAVLRQFYGVDNSAFLDGLRSRGFTITSDSSANYWKTALSLSSSLNFHYLTDLAELPRDVERDMILPTLITNSAARQFLEEQGYKTVAFSTNFFFSEIRDADVYFENKSPLTHFEMNLLTGSMAIFWVDVAQPIFHRYEVLDHFENLQHAAELDGPKFVFAHLVIPHPPFVFDAEGNPFQPMGSIDGNAYMGGVDHYLKGYSGQVRYTNHMVEQALDAILAKSNTPPVIILQGDHGPGAYLNWQSPDQTCLNERFSILNAYYMPGKENAAAAIPTYISPVNTFRVLFNAYFDTRLSMEPNHHFAAPAPYLYNHVEVTDRLDWCPAPVVTPGNSKAEK